MRSRSSLVLPTGFLVLVCHGMAQAENLKDFGNQLFGGRFVVGSGVSGSGIANSQVVTTNFNDVANSIVQSVGGISSLVPVPSASASFSYEFDEDLDLFVRKAESLGPIFTERALTLGAGRLLTSVAYTHVGFDSFNGDSLEGLTVTSPIGSEIFQQSGSRLDGIQDDQLYVRFNSFDITVDNIAFFATYGITDRIDVGIGIPVVRVALKGSVTASIVDEKGNSGRPGALNRLQFCPQGSTVCQPQQGTLDLSSLQSVSDSFDESTFGLGDPLVRGKYRFLESEYVDAAGVLTVTIPGGGADDLRGFNGFTVTPLFVVSKGFGFVSPHVNAGYSFRPNDGDVPQAVWAAGAELRVTEWLTAVPDFLGFMQTSPPEDNLYQFSLGFKANPYRDLILGVNFQLPLNDEGLRSDIIYTATVEYTFSAF